MATLCAKCMRGMNLSRPPVRVARKPCDRCGSQNEDPLGRNYTYPDSLLPGSKNEPNAVAEREEMAKK